MDLPAFVSGIDKAAEESRPISPGDWYKDGILMCGKCNTPLEYLIPESKRAPIPDDADYEKAKAIRKIQDLFYGKKHRVMCKCGLDARTAYEKRKAQEALKERQCDCFGNQLILTKTTFAKDDGRNPRMALLMKRYVAAFERMREQGSGLILEGEQGAGKSFWALAILNNVLTLGRRAVYTSVYKILSSTSPYITSQNVINLYLDADIIVVDDVNKDCLEGKSYNVLVSLINSSHAHGIPIIVATRLGGGDLEKLQAICRNVSLIKLNGG